LLAKAGLPCKKRQAVTPAKDEQKVPDKREALKKGLQRETEIEAAKRVVLMADACRLLAGDSSGYGWGKSSERLTLQEANPKERQRYFGVLNAKSGELVIFEADLMPPSRTLLKPNGYKQRLRSESRPDWTVSSG
jgi:hypothetical protein